MEPIADKKKAIFESTLELVREKGFHGTPMSLVAKRAGVAAGTIYHYFESKQDLIIELFYYIRDQIIAVLKSEDAASVPYHKCFFRIWYGLYEYYSQNPNVLMFFEQFVNSPYNTCVNEANRSEFHKYLFGFFERGIREGHLKPLSPKILGTLAHANIISTVKMYSAGHLVLEEGELKQIPQILWDGMRAQSVACKV
ncbi:TetR/AcrR family transcriptional regulator [Pontibacter chinhatensis]|uniref:Transcriptional regulator, TetR family n=1 Tax=Pontibacter chinhatensis TaxID=1436961 RepID=A0A1I2M4V7_9BACT|nr:TetR/AcrR family transcriptional regulator [Pontibacter chinhatensis]SFF85819.1 transcriptional regulator, TetR family [Pontibacter chinhatensis]